MDHERITYLENEAHYHLTELIKSAEFIRNTVGTGTPNYGSAANLGMHAARASATVMAVSELKRDAMRRGEK